MSDFDRVMIVQVRDGVRRWLEQEEDPRIAVTLALYADAFDTCLAEIDRLAPAEQVWTELLVLVGCTSPDGHAELNQVRDAYERAERAEAQGRRLRESVQAIERLTRGAQGEGNHRLLVQIREAVREALAETEGR